MRSSIFVFVLAPLAACAASEMGELDAGSDSQTDASEPLDASNDTPGDRPVYDERPDFDITPDPDGGCASSSSCNVSQYCDQPMGCGNPGTCKQRPQFCSAIFAPVCGCDKVTYSNACNANRAGTSPAYNGACE